MLQKSSRENTNSYLCGNRLCIKNSAYVDLNNNPFATQLLDMGIATDTGFTKQSGYVTYPLWRFDEKFL